MRQPRGTYGDPIYVVEKHYGFWWLIGVILLFVIRCLVWLIVGFVILIGILIVAGKTFIGWLYPKIFGRKNGQADRTE